MIQSDEEKLFFLNHQAVLVTGGIGFLSQWLTTDELTRIIESTEQDNGIGKP